MELMGKERLARIFQSAICSELEDGTLLVQRPEIAADWSRVRNEWLVIRGEHVARYRFEHTIYSARELTERLETAGFTAVPCFGDLAGRPYDAEASRLVVVAQRPTTGGLEPD